MLLQNEEKTLYIMIIINLPTAYDEMRSPPSERYLQPHFAYIFEKLIP